MMQEQSRYVPVSPAKGLAAAVSCVALIVAERQGMLINMTFNWHFF